MCYHPILLLDVLQNTYSKWLLSLLQTWSAENNIVPESQAGFRKNRSAIDDCRILRHLCEKYCVGHRANLYVAFIDLTQAFDSLSRD